MTHGNSVDATLKLDSPKVIGDIIDWYGENIKIKKENEEIFVNLKVNELALIYWSMQYGEHVEIVSPQETREKIKAMLEKVLNKY